MSSPPESLLTVDLDALAANFAVLRAEAGGAEVAPVVKADGYGLGAAEIARRLRAEGASRFFVARLTEGERLREALGPWPVIHVLDGAPRGAAERLMAAELTPALSTLDQARAWRAAGGGPAALHVDTGMNRLGVSLAEAETLAAEGLAVELLMSHLACAGEPEHPLNALQLERFRAAKAHFPSARASLANTAGVFLGGDYAFDLVRPGIGLYGGGPFGRPDPRLRAVAKLEAPILQVRTVRAGESVGYGAAFTATQTMQVAVLAAGYADGVIRAAGGRASAWLDGRPCPLLGRISMDLIGIDVSNHPGPEPGRLVELVGPDAPVDLLASEGGTIAYEVLVRLGARGRRLYTGSSR